MLVVDNQSALILNLLMKVLQQTGKQMLIYKVNTFLLFQSIFSS